MNLKTIKDNDNKAVHIMFCHNDIIMHNLLPMLKVDKKNSYNRI